MQVRVRLFAGLREQAGKGSVDIEVPDDATVAAVWSALALGDEPPGLLYALNRAYVERTVSLSPGDEVALIPPVSGGDFRLSETPLSLDAVAVYERLGSPEGELALAEAVIYLACAAKSNAVYAAYGAARAFIREDASRPVPLRLRNAPTKLMKTLDYGKGYQYAHADAEGVTEMSCLPESLQGEKYYQPTDRGFEKEIKRRLDGWEHEVLGFADAAIEHAHAAAIQVGGDNDSGRQHQRRCPIAHQRPRVGARRRQQPHEFRLEELGGQEVWRGRDERRR